MGGETDTGGQGRNGLKSFLFFVAMLVVLAAASIGIGGYFAYREVSRPGPLAEETVIMLRSGMSVTAIADALEEAGAVRHAALFKGAVRLKGEQGALKAGEYAIPERASVLDIIELLVEGKSILHYLTAPEGLTTAQILRIVAADDVLVGDVSLMPNEGELLPETYAFTRGETRDGIIRTMMNARNAAIEELWDDRALDLPINTREEAIILASIVEKETGVADERPLVAAVFVNRLKRGMRLESDPTVIYGLTKGEPLGRGLRVSELRGETPYNTYVISGLPPTPIANPGRDAIAAVLNPADVNYIFFVADGSGGHAFAATLAEHNRNVARWRQVERAQRAGE